MKRDYIVGADLIRIISGFGVVFIHVTDPFLTYPPYFGIGGFPWLLVNILNSAFRISVPLFVMLSGFLLLNTTKDMDFKSFYQRRFTRVGFPFLFWMIFYFIWWYLIGVPTSAFIILTSVIRVNVQHLYFMYIIVELYFLTPFFYLFLKHSGPKSHKIAFITAITFSLSIAAINEFIPKARLMLSSNMLTIFLLFIGFYLGGFYFKHVKFFSRNVYYSFLVFLGFVLFTAFSSEGVVNSYLRSYGGPNITIMTFLVFMMLLNISPERKIFRNKYVLSVIKHLSAYVFGIYLVHMFIIDVFDILLGITPPLLKSPVLYLVFIKVLLVFIGCYVFTFIGKRIPYFKNVFG